MRLDNLTINFICINGATEEVKARFEELFSVENEGLTCHKVDWGIMNPHHSVGLIGRDMSLAELMNIFNCVIAYYLGRWRFNRRKGAKGNNFRVILGENKRGLVVKYSIDLLKPSLKVLGREVDIYVIMRKGDGDGLLVLSNGVGTIIIAPILDWNAHYELEDLAVMVRGPDSIRTISVSIEEAIARWEREILGGD